MDFTTTALAAIFSAIILLSLWTGLTIDKIAPVRTMADEGDEAEDRD